MQLASYGIWTHVAVSISYGDNHYIIATSQKFVKKKLGFKYIY